MWRGGEREMTEQARHEVQCVARGQHRAGADPRCATATASQPCAESRDTQPEPADSISALCSSGCPAATYSAVCATSLPGCSCFSPVPRPREMQCSEALLRWSGRLQKQALPRNHLTVSKGQAKALPVFFQTHGGPQR